MVIFLGTIFVWKCQYILRSKLNEKGTLPGDLGLRQQMAFIIDESFEGAAL